MRGVLLASFHPERVLFRLGAWEPGPPGRISTLREAGGRRGFGGLDHQSRQPTHPRGRTPSGLSRQKDLPPKGGKRNDQIKTRLRPD
jgi:hypothetical protein